jgi:hypothetical protein
MGVFSRILGNNNQEGGKKRDDDKKQTSRMEQRLRTARILEGDDDDDDEPNRRRMQAQIERDLNDPKVHKQIVENLYGAYKIRVRLYIVFLFALSFVLCCFLFQDSNFGRRAMMWKTDYGPSLFLSLFSLFSRFFVFEREFASTRDVWTSRWMGLKQERRGFFIRRRRRTRGRETLKEIGSEERLWVELVGLGSRFFLFFFKSGEIFMQ